MQSNKICIQLTHLVFRHHFTPAPSAAPPTAATLVHGMALLGILQFNQSGQDGITEQASRFARNPISLWGVLQ